jgi:hypothetical protein
MDFSCALKVLKLGKRITRPKYWSSEQGNYYIGLDHNIITKLNYSVIEPDITVYTADSEDILATDWFVAPE